MQTSYIADPSSSKHKLSVHPLVILPMGFVLVVLGVLLVNLSFSNPTDRLPQSVREWISTQGTVVNLVEHVETRSLPTYDATINYSVDGKSYSFVENVGSSMKHTSVKYDPQNPTHVRRVPLREELGYATIFAAVLSLLGGAASLYLGITKLRRKDKSQNKRLTLLLGVWTACIGVLDLCLVMDPTLSNEALNSQLPYKVARIDNAQR